MSYRGPALQYQIKKVVTNNKTGDSYAITIPRIIAQKYNDIYFRISTSGNSITFTSGCKITINDIENENTKKFLMEGGLISFK